MRKEQHCINRQFSILPQGKRWISHDRFFGIVRFDIIKLTPSTLNLASEYKDFSSRISRSFCSRILDMGIIYDIDSLPPDSPCFYIKSVFQTGLSLSELSSMNSIDGAMKTLMFRTAFAFHCMGASRCAYDLLDPGSIYLSNTAPLLPYPTTGVRMRPVDSEKQFSLFADRMAISDSLRCLALDFLRSGSIPESEETWCRSFYKEPTSWLLGLENNLGEMLQACEFTKLNSLAGVNFIGMPSLGANTLHDDFCLSRRTAGSIVINTSATSADEFIGAFSDFSLGESSSVKHIVRGIEVFCSMAAVDIVINLLGSTISTDTRSMISEILDSLHSSCVKIFIFSRTELEMTEFFSMPLSFIKARKRQLLSRITSRLSHRSPRVDTEWISPMEYYQLITGTACITMKDPSFLKDSLTTGQGASQTDSSSNQVNASMPFIALSTGKGNDRTFWMTNGKSEPEVIAHTPFKMLNSDEGCLNLREMFTLLENTEISSVAKADALITFLDRFQHTVSLKHKLLLINTILCRNSSEDLLLRIAPLLADLANFAKHAFIQGDQETNDLALSAVGHLLSANPTGSLKTLTEMISYSTGLQKSLSVTRDALEEAFRLHGESYSPSIFEPGDLIHPVTKLATNYTGEQLNYLIAQRFPKMYASGLISAALELIRQSDFILAETHLRNASFIAGISEDIHNLRIAEGCLLAIRRKTGSCTAWEAETSIRNSKVLSEPSESSDVPINSAGFVLEAALQQMQLQKCLAHISKCRDVSSLGIGSDPNGSNDENRCSLAEESLEALMMMNVSEKYTDLLPSRFRFPELISMEQCSESIINTTAAKYQVNLSKESISDLLTMDSLSFHQKESNGSGLQASLRKTALSNELDRFLSSLRRGDLLRAYLALCRLLSTEDNDPRGYLAGKGKTVKALDRRYQLSSLPLINGSTPIQILLGEDTENSFRFNTMSRNLISPDSLEQLKSLLQCDALWLFRATPRSFDLVAKAASDKYPHDVSWINETLERTKLIESGILLNATGTGWASGRAVPATAAVKLAMLPGHAATFRVLVAETLCPGKALTGKREKLLLQFASSYN